MNVIFFAFTLLFFNQAEGAKKCYVCEDPQCKDVKEQTCKIKNFMCQTSYQTINGSTEYVRQCQHNTLDLQEDCLKININAEGASCYTCHKDLCNIQDNVSSSDLDLDVNKIVKKCYVCKGQCEDPEEQKCEIKDYLCQTSIETKYDMNFTKRQCVPNTKAAKETCKKLNNTIKTSCFTCNKDLCNYNGIKDENVAAPTMVLAILVSLVLTKL